MSARGLIHLVRHGVAADRGSSYPDDAERPLTPEGMTRIRDIGRGLVALGVEVDVILTSPFVRTRQTADLLAESWSPSAAVSNLESLAVGGRTGDVLAALAAAERGRRLMLVGHMPGIGMLAAELLGVVQPLDFKKGAVACLALDGLPRRGGATLRWFATPRLLRLVGHRR